MQREFGLTCQRISGGRALGDDCSSRRPLDALVRWLRGRRHLKTATAMSTNNSAHATRSVRMASAALPS